MNVDRSSNTGNCVGGLKSPSNDQAIMSSRSANYLINSYHLPPQGVECMHAQDGRSVCNHNVGVEQSHNPPTWVHVFKSPNPSSIRTQVTWQDRCLS